MKEPTVTVQIVTYNSAQDIEQCLEGVLRQSYQAEKIIVVDNASSDDTLERVYSFSKKNGVSVKCIDNQANTGFAPAHNQAIRLTNSDYVLVLNPDVILKSDYIELLVKIMEMRPQVGSATGRLIQQDNPEVIDSTGLAMNQIWRAFDRGAGEPVIQWLESTEVFGVSGAAAMYSRRMIEDILVLGEFFDEDFFAYKEDVDVAWRAVILGWKAYYCAEAVGLHKRGWKKGSRSAQPVFIRRYSFINRYKMIYKNLSGRSWMRNLLKLLAYEFAVHGYIMLREPKMLGAWIDFWRQFPSLREKRGEIRAKKMSKRRSLNDNILP